MFRKVLLTAMIAIVCASSTAHAIMEVGVSGNYRRAVIDTDAYDESKSVTGSISYYLNDASALELSYTDAQNRRAISEGKPNGHTTSIYQRMAGLDFMYTMGAREAFFRPYIKVGGLWILEKRIIDQYRDSNGTLFDPSTVEGKKGAVPSAGIGFRLALTESLQFKVGADAWTSQPTSETPVTVDYAGRLGLSLFF